MWPNVVTSARIASIPFFLWFLFHGSTGTTAPPGSFSAPWAGTDAATWTASAIFAVAAASDLLDGYLARRLDCVTELGQWLDPLADKLLVGAALIGLVALRGLPIWVAIVIGVRELAVSILRAVGVRRGNAMPASFPGKVKTAIQIPMVLVWLFPRRSWMIIVQDVVMYLAVVLTVGSGALYFTKAKQMLSRRESIS
ncbi:MAG: CDP-diacylglycerol--glycerol-3-phosphate 3-phosphatidyltransferase [Actinomycetota bacterium]|nr:CDP-diacylglycerol--glycerol-3-phosphate 3-phosphatidyltransferase [Actinomycetota bacterium]